MKTVPAAVTALLAADAFYAYDLYTFTLLNGDIYRYVSSQMTVSFGGYSYAPMNFKRGTAKSNVGIQVPSLSFTVAPLDTDLVDGLPFLQILRSGGFDNATLSLDRGFAAMGSPYSIVGTVNVFLGLVSDVKGGRLAADFTIKAMTVLLDVQMPRNVYQTTCQHQLYDGGCTISRAANTVTESVTASPAVNGFTTGLTQASNWFAQGVLTFISGANNGLKRTVATHTNLGGSGSLTFFQPLPVAPAIGDTFTIYPGCDKTASTCNTKFANLAHFKGFPYVPAPETSL